MARPLLLPALTRVGARFLAAAGAGAAPARTALYDLHLRTGGKMVEFCGWSMPVLYEKHGVLKEHLHCRTSASLFDVSHMGQLRFRGKDAEKFLESLAPVDLVKAKTGKALLTILTSEEGTIIDDMMMSRRDKGHVYVVINAARRDVDLAHIRRRLADPKWKDVSLEEVHDTRSLIAVQGPKAVQVISRLVDSSFDPSKLLFMSGAEAKIKGLPCLITRCGYTGEDGYEISVLNEHAVPLAETLLSQDEVLPAGLGARDSLRLEAGLCLYGHDMDLSTGPVEASLGWLIGKRRRAEGGFVGSASILAQLKNPAAVPRRRVGLLWSGAPAREGCSVWCKDTLVGRVTSGSPSPSLKKAIAMAYVPASLSKPGTPLVVGDAVKEGEEASKPVKPRKATVAKMPFVPPGHTASRASKGKAS